MCENPLSPEMKAALAFDFEHARSLPNRLRADHLGELINPAHVVASDLRSLTRLACPPALTTSLLLSEMKSGEVPSDRVLA